MLSRKIAVPINRIIKTFGFMSLSIEVAAKLWNPIKLLKLTRPFAFDYPASRVFFDLPRLVGKRKKTLPTASRIHIEHAPKSNVTKPRSASLSSCGEMTGKKIHCIIKSLKLIYRLLRSAQNLYLVGD